MVYKRTTVVITSHKHQHNVAITLCAGIISNNSSQTHHWGRNGILCDAVGHGTDKCRELYISLREQLVNVISTVKVKE